MHSLHDACMRRVSSVRLIATVLMQTTGPAEEACVELRQR
jgi:hypothetical protein